MLVIEVAAGIVLGFVALANLELTIRIVAGLLGVAFLVLVGGFFLTAFISR